MSRLFGTDGIRGVANEFLTPAIAYKLGQACVKFMGKSIVLGRDTRRSGEMLESAMVAGITSAGGDAFIAGIIPTPAIALLIKEKSFDGGCVISASHNPPEYNGLKLFDSQGFKLPDAKEDEIQAFIESGGLEADPDYKMCTGHMVGRSHFLKDANELYINHAVGSIKKQGIDFAGLTIAFDAGHGASFYTTSVALGRLGAKVKPINTDYNGDDINVNCGSTHLEPLAKLMQDTGADIGIAHDGDADRVMMMTPAGTVIDGDIVEAVCGIDLKRRAMLPGNTIVSTVMCNLGLVRAMQETGINVVQTKVGDRYVLEEMLDKNYAIGGEQSGHVIMLEHNSTGDGLMTAVQFIAAVKRTGKTFDEAISFFTKFPQTLINVRVKDKAQALAAEELHEAVELAEKDMADTGRVLLRESGTEPVIRVMVEAKTQEMADMWAKKIAEKVK